MLSSLLIRYGDASKSAKAALPPAAGLPTLDAAQALDDLCARIEPKEAAVASAQPEVVRTVAELRHVVAGWRREGRRVALVPTMGALHAGHLALVRRAATRAEATVVSIFVNPTQFAPHEDLARYPRDEAADLARLAPEPCHLVWAPSPAEMYPEGFATRIVPAGAALGLEADVRPHFFSGVATVCAKLFGAIAPDLAVFGEKDYQQVCVIRQMVRDLDMNLEIVGEPTVREADGLALSSRNAYLSSAERTIAPALHRVLGEVAMKAAAIARGNEADAAPKRPRPAPLVPDPLLARGEPQMPQLAALCEEAALAIAEAGFSRVDYVAVREAETLKVVSRPTERPLRVLAAAWLGSTRLIDNVPA
jgi:pantoate--beta-alanine ligase